MDWFENSQLENGMWYTTWNVTTGEMSDSAYTEFIPFETSLNILLRTSHYWCIG